MSRFGWPRPKAEGVTDELAALQASQRKLPGAEPDGLPPGVRAGGAFPKAAGTGCDTDAVDVALDRLEQDAQRSGR